MIKDYSAQLNIKEGLNAVNIEEEVFKYICGFAIVSLNNGRKLELKTEGSETALLILKGKCDIALDGRTYKNLGLRDSVFNGKPTAAYIPINKEYTLIGYDAEIAICSAKCAQDSRFAIITPQDVTEKIVGKDNWQRQVRTIIGPPSPSVSLILGETINPPGNWSGTPAHKHEKPDAPRESLHEELYYFKTDKPQGFGIERLYSYEKNINELVYLKEGTVTFMPWGYHQIVAGAGYTLYYLFFLSGMSKDLIGSPDPLHKWISE